MQKLVPAAIWQLSVALSSSDWSRNNKHSSDFPLVLTVLRERSKREDEHTWPFHMAVKPQAPLPPGKISFTSNLA